MLNPGAPVAVPATLVSRYDVPGPRYTSYPTAPAWTAGFHAIDYDRVLRAVASEDPPLAVYAHFPYCATKCHYCGCTALVTSRSDTVDRYLNDLEHELDRVVAALGRGRRVAQLHWGGGTPNRLSLRQLERAARLFTDRFRLLPDAEVSIEADPRLVTREQLETLRHLGFDRISFGVQDLDPTVQEAIGRLQPRALVEAVVAGARAVGFAGINLDLIHGLPYQTTSSVAATIDAVLAMRPDRVACFGYAHLPAQRPHQRVIPAHALPGPATRFALFQQVVEAFTGAGYAWLGLDHFAREDDALAIAQRAGRLHRNFMGYTTMPGQHLVGVGMSAISDVGGAYAQNAPGLAAWREAVAHGRLPTVRGHARSPDDRVRQAAIQRLMCDLTLPFALAPWGDAELRRRYGRFVADGLVQFDADGLHVTARGRYFLRNLCMALDAYLPDTGPASPFSRTV